MSSKFRTGKRIDGSDYSYPISTKGGGYEGKNLQVHRIASTDGGVGEDTFINIARRLPDGRSICPVKGRRLPKIYRKGDIIEVVVRDKGSMPYLNERKIGKHSVGVYDGEGRPQSFCFNYNHIMEPETKRLFLDAISTRIEKPLVQIG